MSTPLGDAPAVAAGLIAADPHRAGSVDRTLLDAGVWLTPATRPSLYRPPATPMPAPVRERPELARIVAEAGAGAVHEFQRATALRRWVAAIPRRFPEGGRSTREGFWDDFHTFLCGGTEEEVIKKGSPLAAELSRVLVTLTAMAGLPARLVHLFAAAPAERHCVVEIFIAGRWTVFYPVSDRSFAWPKHGYTSAWDLRWMPALIDGLQDAGRLRYVAGRFYQTAAIAAYDPQDASLTFPWDPLDPDTAARLRDGAAS